MDATATAARLPAYAWRHALQPAAYVVAGMNQARSPLERLEPLLTLGQSVAQVAQPAQLVAVSQGPVEGSDSALLEGVRARDTAALEALYDRHHQVALSVAYRLLRNQQLAEDVVQEAFLSVWRQGATYRLERGSMRNWLLSIVHHRAVDQLRRKEAVPLPAGDDDTTFDVPAPESSDVWQQASASMEAESVRAALAALPEEQRETVALAYYGGLTCQQVAERVGVPLGTVKGRMRLALQKLRTALAPLAPGADLPAAGSGGSSPAAGPEGRFGTGRGAGERVS